MILRYFYDKKLSQASYLLGCSKTGEALVIDSARDISPYLTTAQEEKLRITHVAETHIHADYVSGSRELAAHSGALLYLSDMGDDNWKYAFPEQNVILVRDNDSWMVGNIRVQVLHTPGHTPEHIAFMITDTAGADRPMGIFSGDFVFVGDVGRPDLLEKAAGMAGTTELGARQQYRSVQRLKEFPDYLQIWPAHGAGSACGKALGAVPSTTLGYEKLFNPAFRHANEEDFVNWLLDGQPEPPRYFAQMKRVNKVGPAFLANLTPPPHLDRAALDKALAEGALVIDSRDKVSFASAHVPGTVSISASNDSFSTYTGWFVDFNNPPYLIVPSEETLSGILGKLRAIGVDDIPGYFTPEVISGETEQLSLLSSADLVERMKYYKLLIVDVRGQSEYEEKHINGAKHIPLGDIPDRLNEIPHDAPVVLHCMTGMRSQIAASFLLKFGYRNVASLNDNMDNWAKALPLA